MAEWLSVIIGLLGVSGIVFTALRYRRDDTTAVVNQQAALFDEMRVITENLRAERDALALQVDRLRAEVGELRSAAGRIEDRLDAG